MRVTVEKNALAAVLGRATSVIPARSNIPILTHVLLAARNGMLAVSATDLDMWLKDSAAAQVDVEGAVAVNAARLAAVVARQPDGAQISLQAADGELTISCGRSRCRLSTLPDLDFPDMSDPVRPHCWSIEAADLRRALGVTVFAASENDARYYLQGVYCEVRDTALHFAATDGHMLAHLEHPLPEGATGMPGVIIPSGTCRIILKLAAKAAGLVKVSVSDRCVALDFSGSGVAVVFTSKLIDGPFPDYSRVLPPLSSKGAAAPLEELRQALERVRAVSPERETGVVLLAEKGLLTLTMRPALEKGGGESVDEVDAAVMGGGMKAAYNSAYLSKILAQLRGDRCVLDSNGPCDPMRLSASGDDNARYVLMPMALNRIE
jgi:DNA polymerase-3 subunit beta